MPEPTADREALVERMAEAIWGVLWPTTRPMNEVRNGPMYADKVGFALDSANAALAVVEAEQDGCGICGHVRSEHDGADGICVPCMAIDSDNRAYAHIFEVAVVEAEQRASQSVSEARKALYWKIVGSRSHMQMVRETANAFAEYDALVVREAQQVVQDKPDQGARDEAWTALQRARALPDVQRLDFASRLLTRMQVEPGYLGWFDVACVTPEMILEVAATSAAPTQEAHP